MGADWICTETKANILILISIDPWPILLSIQIFPSLVVLIMTVAKYQIARLVKYHPLSDAIISRVRRKGFYFHFISNTVPHFGYSVSAFFCYLTFHVIEKKEGEEKVKTEKRTYSPLSLDRWTVESNAKDERNVKMRRRKCRRGRQTSRIAMHAIPFSKRNNLRMAMNIEMWRKSLRLKFNFVFSKDKCFRSVGVERTNEEPSYKRSRKKET